VPQASQSTVGIGGNRRASRIKDRGSWTLLYSLRVCPGWVSG
jgi:hypothetical protein